MAIRVVARERLIPEKKEEALAVFSELIAETRKEKGNISYNLHELIDDPNVVAMIEVWESMEDLEAHLKSEHFNRLIPKIGPMTAEESRLEVYKEII